MLGHGREDLQAREIHPTGFSHGGGRAQRRRLGLLATAALAVALGGCGGAAGDEERPGGAAARTGERRIETWPTLDPRAQRAAQRALRGRIGAAVAVDVASGAVLAWAGTGGTDPGTTRIAPGSTLKALFAGWALESGVITEATPLAGDGSVLPYPGVVNAAGARYQPMTVAESLVRSSNTAAVDLVHRLGARGVERALRSAGWGRRLRIDLPAPYRGRSRARVRTLRRADGRYRDPDRHQGTTVGQLAILAAVIAGDGRARPLTTTGPVPPRRGRRVWAPRISRTLRRALRAAVRRGTGRSMLGGELAIGAKTGTMPRPDGRAQASVIAFAEARRPRHAVAVSLTVAAGETGGSAAGPVARTILEALHARG